MTARAVLVLAWICLVQGAAGERVTVSILATTDLHGNLYPVDYYVGRPAARGLAKAASLIAEARRQNPNNLLIDCGDTIQGSPLEYVYQRFVRSGRAPLGLEFPGGAPHADPMMLAMNHAGYDGMVLGNHEFNFGLKNLERARSDAHFPWLSANTIGGRKPFVPYLVKTTAGVKVAVVGITTPAVPTWEKPENIGPYKFQSPVETLRRLLPELRRRERPDVVVVAAHAGLGRDLKTGAPRDAEGNPMYEVAVQFPDLDAIVYGHTHSEMESYRVGTVLLAQPRNWGMSVARIEFTLERDGSGPWKVVEKNSRLLRATESTPADPQILEIARPYHETAERYLSTNVASSAKLLSGRLGRVEDSALVDAIQEVQLHYAKAEVSFASMFNPAITVQAGPVTVRQIAALYPYENVLYAVEGTGKMVKDALENAARFYLSCRDAACNQSPLINSQIFGYNYDVAQGVSYEIDLTRPEGDRIRNLTWKGRPLDQAQKLRIAVNNYRAAGSAGYGMFTGAPVLWQSSEEVRELMIEYFTARKRLPSEPDRNWRVVPEAAAETLRREALTAGGRSRLI